MITKRLVRAAKAQGFVCPKGWLVTTMNLWLCVVPRRSGFRGLRG